MTRTHATIGAIALLFIVVAGFTTFSSQEPARQENFSQKILVPSRTILLDGRMVHIAVADTDALRANGLSGYAPLEEDHGMLFIFPMEDRYGFWMKDMLFPIDIVWLDAAGKIVHIEKNVSPDTYPASFTPDSPAQYVLEVRAGYTDQYDIREGESATLSE